MDRDFGGAQQSPSRTLEGCVALACRLHVNFPAVKPPALALPPTAGLPFAACETALAFAGATRYVPMAMSSKFAEAGADGLGSDSARGRRAAETRAALIAAARRIFAQKGYHAAGTHEIVAAADVSRGALQYHFPRKEELFLAVFQQVQQDMIARAAVGATGDGAAGTWPRLKADILSYLHAATTPEVQRIVLTDGPAVLGWPEWRRLEALYGLGMIMTGVKHGIQSGLIRKQPPLPLSHLILSIIDEAALMVANAADPEAATRQAQTALDTLLSNLA